MDDAVSNWMELTSTYGVVVARNLLPRSWAVRLPARPSVAFHVVEKGSACVLVPGERPVHMGAGELVLVPHGHAHVIGNSPHTRARNLDEIHRLRVKPATHVTTLISGEYRSELGLCSQMTLRLPNVVHCGFRKL